MGGQSGSSRARARGHAGRVVGQMGCPGSPVESLKGETVMKLLVNTNDVSFTVTREAEEKTDQNGKQKVDRRTGELLYTLQVMALDTDGGEMLKVTVPGTPPKVTRGQQVNIADLEAIPWVQENRNGVAFRAKSITAVSAQKAA